MVILVNRLHVSSDTLCGDALDIHALLEICMVLLPIYPQTFGLPREVQPLEQAFSTTLCKEVIPLPLQASLDRFFSCH